VAKGLPHQWHHESQKEIKLKIWKWSSKCSIKWRTDLHAVYKLHIINQISVWLWSVGCDTVLPNWRLKLLPPSQLKGKDWRYSHITHHK